jgi:RNA polymerase sigma-54 factor
MQAIVNDLAFTQGVYTSIEEVEVLRAIQTFDPAGIAARDLKECLLLQLDRKSQNEPRIQDAIRIVDEYFDEFSKNTTRRYKSALVSLMKQ